MVINTKELISLPVRTVAGTAIGKVSSIDFDAETGRLIAILVNPKSMVSALSRGDLLIQWDQIVEITAKQVTVKDAMLLNTETSAVPMTA